MAWSDDCIYNDRKTPCRDPDEHRWCTGSWRGVVSLGYGPDGKRTRRKVRGQTKAEVRDKLRDLHSDTEAVLRKPQAVTVQNAADDWLTHGLDGRSAMTVRRNRTCSRRFLRSWGAKTMTTTSSGARHCTRAGEPWPARRTPASRGPRSREAITAAFTAIASQR